VSSRSAVRAPPARATPKSGPFPVYSGGCADEATGLQVVARGHTAVLFCATIDQTLAETELGGDGVSASDLGGLTSVESPGVYYDHVLKAWVLTYSDPNCGYCAGTGTGFATHNAQRASPAMTHMGGALANTGEQRREQPARHIHDELRWAAGRGRHARRACL
jgi:hypothetical protein